MIVAYLSYPVTGIRVEGATMYPESDAWNAVSQHASLLTINEENLERRVEANPWVEGAEVLKDNGSGIPDEMKGRVFKVLERGEESVHGFGLGLTIVKEVVNLTGGEVTIEDRVKGDPAQGTNFIVILPKGK